MTKATESAAAQQASGLDRINAYIAACPPQQGQKLHQLYVLLQRLLPQAQQKIAWGMPTFYQGGNIIHFAAHKHHIGLYPGSGAIQALQADIAPLAHSKGAIQIPYESPLPEALIKKIIAFNLALFAQKKSKKPAARPKP